MRPAVLAEEAIHARQLLARIADGVMHMPETSDEIATYEMHAKQTMIHLADKYGVTEFHDIQLVWGQVHDYVCELHFPQYINLTF